jgi:tRNA threonylcarbamoyladenosine biosynthesis protein TsaB
MNLLAIDSACSILCVAVARADEIFYEETDAGIRHSELVMDRIDAQMKKASLKPGELDGILCMGGPGSFTGLRIGYSVAKGLALSLSIPFAPIPTLDCIALSANAAPPLSGGLVVPVIEARKNVWFFTVYRGAARLLNDTDAAAGEIAAIINEKKERDEKITLTGPGAQSLYNSLPEDFLNSRIFTVCEKRGYARELIYIAKSRNIFSNNNSEFLYSGPEYIRKTDAELNLTGPSIQFCKCF